jgi:hypothetical protein
LSNKELKKLMGSRMVEVELTTKDILVLHAASVITASKDKTWSIIRKRFGPIAQIVDTSKITKKTENDFLKVSLSEADILFIHGMNVFADHRQSLAKWIDRWISPVAMKILSDRKEYH